MQNIKETLFCLLLLLTLNKSDMSDFTGLMKWLLHVYQFKSDHVMISPSHTVSLHHCPWSEQLLQCTERAPVTAQTWHIANELQWKQSADQGRGNVRTVSLQTPSSLIINLILPCNSLLIFTFWYIINMSLLLNS